MRRLYRERLGIGPAGNNHAIFRESLWPKRNSEEIMNKTYRFAALLGLALALVSLGVAQALAQQPGASLAPATAVPPDQQPTKEQLAKLFELMRVREQLASMTKMMPALMQQQMQTQFKQMQKDHPELSPITEEQQRASAKVMGKYMERVMNLIATDDMVADMATVYQRHLTRSDVDGMIVFYSSPAGQHMLDMMPVIMQEYMPMVMQQMQGRIKPLTDEMTKEMGEAISSHAAPAESPAQK
jgi:hypothetical protein